MLSALHTTRSSPAARAPDGSIKGLLLTDRANDSTHLQQYIAAVGSFTVKALHQELEKGLEHSIIICDVGFDNIISIELLQASIAHYRTDLKIPLLCIARDRSELTQTYGRAIGAAAILPFDAPKATLQSTIRRLMTAGHGSRSGNTVKDGGHKADVREAGQALSALFAAARQQKPVSAAAMAQGGNAVIAAIGKARIRAWLDVVWQYDDVTYQHCLLVAGLVAAFAGKLGLTLKSQQLLSQAALVHDIGKAHIPYEILNKAGRLSDAEMAVMRRHPGMGHGMLAGQPDIDPQLLDIVRHHHEYIDGSGYPDGLRDDQISQFVRLTTICDIYAALIERRPYKAPKSPQQALSILGEMTGKLDLGLLSMFHTVIKDA